MDAMTVKAVEAGLVVKSALAVCIQMISRSEMVRHSGDAASRQVSLRRRKRSWGENQIHLYSIIHNSNESTKASKLSTMSALRRPRNRPA
jgi:hypothetical protein